MIPFRIKEFSIILTPKIMTIYFVLFILLQDFLANSITACQFYPVGEYLKFIRIPENLPLGTQVLTLEVHPRNHLTIMPVDKEEDTKYFTYKDINSTHISVNLAQSLEDLVDSQTPRNLLKFRFVCDYSTPNGNSLTSSHLSVTVYVEDINDHSPKFIEAPYHIDVNELTPPGTIIFRGIKAFDGDKPNTPNSDINYAIVKGNEEGKFSLESGQKTALILRKILDYDTGDRVFSLVVTATDRGLPPRTSTTTVTVNIHDNDDLGPKFTQDIYRTTILESFPFVRDFTPREIHLNPPIHADDQDKGINIPIKYSLTSGNERGFFRINSDTGIIYLQRPIDLDIEQNLLNNTFILQLHAFQIDNPLKYTTAKLEIEILDVNDNLPLFEVDFYNISIVENLPNGFSVLQVVAHDKDQGENSEFNYELDDPSGAFLVDPKSGWLTVKDERILDREKISLIKMKVNAVEKKPSVLPITDSSTSSTHVEVTILDANDNNPTFIPSNIYEFVAQTDAKIGTVLGQIKAIDKDFGKNGIVLYGLQQTKNISRVPFAVDSHSGVVTVTESPLIEGRHAIFVEATDQPVNPSERRISLAVVTIDVFPPDDNSEETLPDFIGAPYEFWVGANVPMGTSVGQIRINNALKKKKGIFYDLLHTYHEGVPFAVEEQTGTITVIDEIENFVRRSYDFEAVVTNDKDLALVTNVSIHVVDPNTERDLFTNYRGATKAPLVFHVKENVENAFIGQVYPHNSTNTTRNVRFFIANQRDVPNIAITEDGDLYTIQSFDYEVKQNYSITIIAETSKGLGIYQVTIVIDDVNDNPPIFELETYEGYILENSPPGTEVVLKQHISIHDNDDYAVNKQYNLTLNGNGSHLFAIDFKTGRVFFTGKDSHRLDREDKSTYVLKIIASDEINQTSTAKLIININDTNDNPPVFSKMIVSPDYGISVSNDKNDNNELSNSINHHSPTLLVPENITIGTVILRLLAQDKDTGENAKISYNIVNETNPSYFMVNPRSGEVSVVRLLPAGRKIHIHIVASDPGNLNDSIIIRILVTDVNDHPPMFKKSWYAFDIYEGNYQRYEIGSVMASDNDLNENAKINYKIDKHSSLNSNVTFDIIKSNGKLLITGNLDREKQDNYKIIVVAYDSGIVPLSSTVDIEINVLDSNDNPPKFYGFVDLENINGSLIPTYYASVGEDTPIGSTVYRVYANDSDFIGNGNGLILFNLLQPIGHKQYFTIDSKDGIISTISMLDYETQDLHNITILARDLGYPSLTSTAILYMKVLDVEEDSNQQLDFAERPVFQHRYYEVEVDENSVTPLKILQLNVSDTYIKEKMKYEIVTNDSEIDHLFTIDMDNGTLFLLQSLDREYKDIYQFKVKVEKRKSARGVPMIIYPIDENRLSDLEYNEAKIVVKVRDINDNAPKFKNKGRPFLAAIPTSIGFGQEILKVEADDPDEGINGDIRYQILGNEDVPMRFAIDPLSGQVRSVSSFSREAGRVFGFDVKAMDCQGAESGRSSIANVFVYVIDDKKQVVLVMGRKPTEIEDQVEDITRALQNVTGFDVRVRKLEPHIEKNLVDTTSTDVYLYAVDPDLNIMIDMETLNKVFHKKKSEIKGELARYRVLEIANNPKHYSQKYLLTTLEVGVLALGCIIFLGALISVGTLACIRRNKRFGRDMTMFPPVGFALAESTTTLRKPFPTFLDGFRYDPEPIRSLSMCKQGPTCLHHNGRSRSCGTTRRTSTSGCLEASATSLHSDSGIVARVCHCGHSSIPSSGDSSGYEDSLRACSNASNDQATKSEMRYRTHAEKIQIQKDKTRSMMRDYPLHQNMSRLDGAAGSSNTVFW